MKKSIVTAIIVTASTASIIACAAPNPTDDAYVPEPIVANVDDPTHPDYINTEIGTEEDDIEFICETMGNELCGPGPYETLTVDAAIDRCILTTTTHEDELACIEYVIPLFGHHIEPTT